MGSGGGLNGGRGVDGGWVVLYFGAGKQDTFNSIKYTYVCECVCVCVWSINTEGWKQLF